MAKGLLLGNGINSRLCINDLSVECIAERFKKNVLVYSVIINNIFGVQIAEDFLKNSEISVSKLGIETLAGILYKYIKGNKNNVSGNDITSSQNDYSWNIVSDFTDKIEQVITDNKIKLTVDDENLFDESFVLQVLVNSDVKVSITITIVEPW